MLLDPTLTAAYVVVAAALALAPGPDVMFVLANGLRHQVRGAIAATCGIAAAVGISAVIAASELAFELLRYGGALYLLYLGIQSILAFFKSGTRDAQPSSAAPPSIYRVFKRGLITNLLNPKVIIFYIALLPQFVNTELGHVGLQIVLLGCIHTCIGFAYLLCISLVVGKAADWLTKTQIARWLDAIAGVF